MFCRPLLLRVCAWWYSQISEDARHVFAVERHESRPSGESPGVLLSLSIGGLIFNTCLLECLSKNLLLCSLVSLRDFCLKICGATAPLILLTPVSICIICRGVWVVLGLGWPSNTVVLYFHCSCPLVSSKKQPFLPKQSRARALGCFSWWYSLCSLLYEEEYC